jgi:hypothetical protein
MPIFRLARAMPIVRTTRDFFEKGRRKDGAGKAIRWKEGVGNPIVVIYREVYVQLETLVSQELRRGLSAKRAQTD